MTEPKLQLNTNAADVSENDLRERYPEVLEVLLCDHTTGKNIFWATDNYAEMGEGFNYHDEIMPACITGKYGKIIRPRVQKDKELQTARIRDMAEVFTPSWICNAQTILIRFMFLMTDESLTSLGKKVPDLLDYSSNSTLIDFTKDLNAQLYALVGFTSNEINFIETAIKPME